MSIVPFLRKLSIGAAAACILGLVMVRAASAKGNFAWLTIEDPVSARKIVVNEPGLMSFFAFSDFENGVREGPSVAGAGYEITRYGAEDGGPGMAFDRLRWYDYSTSPTTRGHGWIHYEGIVNGSSEYDGLWFATTRNADAMMEDILAGRAHASFHLVDERAVGYGAIGIAAALLIGGISTFGFVRRRGRSGGHHQG